MVYHNTMDKGLGGRRFECFSLRVQDDKMLIRVPQSSANNLLEAWSSGSSSSSSCVVCRTDCRPAGCDNGWWSEVPMAKQLR